VQDLTEAQWGKLKGLITEILDTRKEVRLAEVKRKMAFEKAYNYQREIQSVYLKEIQRQKEVAAAAAKTSKKK
jgi:hypothetical protein